MDHDNECRHGLEHDTCSICLGRAKPTQRDYAAYVFEARFETICPECRKPIYPGQVAVKKGERPSLHVRCG